MGNEIKVGEYVRTIDGYIGKKVKDGLRSGTIEIEDNICSWITDIYAVSKHSPNLIDLIQYGDYVNGKQVSNVDKVDNTNFIEWTDGDMYKTEIENDKFIETIVTKEQFESISYKVERNN